MQATIYKITPFDADSGYSVKFAWNGNQVFKNRCIIRESESGKLIYDQTVSSFKLEHNIDLSKSQLNTRPTSPYLTKTAMSPRFSPLGLNFYV